MTIYSYYIGARLARISSSLYSQAYSLRSHFPAIKTASDNEDVDPNITLGIIMLESINRSFVYRIFEYVALRLFPQYLLHHDCSIGIAQIKPSTAASVCSKAGRELLVALLDDHDCIAICAALLSNYIREYNLNTVKTTDKLDYIAQLYTTGHFNQKRPPWTIIYSSLLSEIVSRRLYDRISRFTDIEFMETKQN